MLKQGYFEFRIRFTYKLASCDSEIGFKSDSLIYIDLSLAIANSRNSCFLILSAIALTSSTSTNFDSANFLIATLLSSPGLKNSLNTSSCSKILLNASTRSASGSKRHERGHKDPAASMA